MFENRSQHQPTKIFGKGIKNLIFEGDVNPVTTTKLSHDLFQLISDEYIKTIILTIYSCGGNTVAGLSQAEEIKKMNKDIKPKSILTVAKGVVKSAAVSILASGNKKLSNENTKIMIHLPGMTYFTGKPEEYRMTVRDTSSSIARLKVLTGKKQSTIEKDLKQLATHTIQKANLVFPKIMDGLAKEELLPKAIELLGNGKNIEMDAIEAKNRGIVDEII